MEMTNKKILVIDDDADIAGVVRFYLGKDFEVHHASSGEAALEILPDLKPGLILLDVVMEGMSGLDVCERIKSTRCGKMRKVVLLTGKNELEDRLIGYKKGADDYLIKPFNGEELKAKVNVFLKLFNLELSLQNDNDDLKTVIDERSNQLLRSEKLTYLGLNTAEIVHNLKNPLAIIHHLARNYEKGNIPENFSPVLNEQIDKCFDIIKTVMKNTRSAPEDSFQLINLNDLVQKELEFLRISSRFKDEIDIELNLESQTHVHGNPYHYQQIVGNLLKNAAEAMVGREDQRIKITTKDQDTCVLLEVEDSGEGIDSENLEKIFDSNFSTKFDEEDPLAGSGLGLAYCKKILAFYGGIIKVRSEKGVGTTFALKFWSDLGKNNKVS